MVGAIAHWENAEWVVENKYAQKKILDFYKLTVKNFNSPHLILIDTDNQNPTCGDEEITFESYKTLEEALKKHKNKNFVFLEKKSVIPKEYKPTNLKSFTHPKKDVFYVVGSDFGSIPHHLLKKDNKNFHHVYIDTKNDIPLWAHTALGIAFYDRSVKEK